MEGEAYDNDTNVSQEKGVQATVSAENQKRFFLPSYNAYFEFVPKRHGLNYANSNDFCGTIEQL